MTTQSARFLGVDTRPDPSPFAEDDGVENLLIFDGYDGRMEISTLDLVVVVPQRESGDLPMFPKPRQEFDEDDGMIEAKPVGYTIPLALVAIAILCIASGVIFCAIFSS
jgi:hypothetical protein